LHDAGIFFYRLWVIPNDWTSTAVGAALALGASGPTAWAATANMTVKPITTARLDSIVIPGSSSRAD
jgi:hypothetical protein